MVIAVKYWFGNTSYPHYEMPVMPFAYRAKCNDIYVFDYNGNIYKIVRNSKMTDSFEWAEPTVQCLKDGSTLDWLEKVGVVDIEILQEKYNLFREIMKNPKFAIYPKSNIIPNDINHSYTKTTENWYGYIKDMEVTNIFYDGYLGYDVTDDRAFEIVDWINEEVGKCK